MDKNITAREIMTETVISVSPDTAIDEAMAIIIENRISGLPVVDGNGRIVGILTEIDRLKMLNNLAADSLHLVSDIMSRNVVCVEADSSVEQVAHLLLSGAIRRVPVVEHQKVIGIISRRDLVRAIYQEEVQA